MKLAINKIVVITIIASVFLTSCGVTGPETINWDTAESDTNFAAVESNTDISTFEPNAQSQESKSDKEVPWEMLLGEEDRLNCEHIQIVSYECFGDTNNGYKCIDGTCYIFYNSQLYALPEDLAENYKERVLYSWTAQQQVDTFGFKTAGWVVTGLGIGAAVVSAPITGAIIAIVGLGVVIGVDFFEKQNEIYDKYRDGYEANINTVEIERYEVSQ